MLLMASFGSNKVKLTEGTNFGNLAPVELLQGIIIEDNKYLLINFWAASNPQSRIENLKLNHLLSSPENSHIQLVSISLDNSEAVFKGVVQADQLNESTHFYLSQDLKKKFEDSFYSNDNLSNWLINKEGMIISKNLSMEEILKTIQDSKSKI